ncbi:hypothetical protein Tco_1580181, partial [Tanacetum coccineum]
HDCVLVVEDSWNHVVVYDSNVTVLLKNKFKFLKQKLKAWSWQKKSIRENDCRVLQDKLLEIDLRLDKGEDLHDDVSNCANVFRSIGEIDHKNSIDLAQKAKIKWAIEGDENSKKFHGIVNKKQRQLAIKDWTRVPIEGNFPRFLGPGLSSDLEGKVTNDKIKNAVWDCGSDKSSRPDGFTFEFFKKFWLSKEVNGLVLMLACLSGCFIVSSLPLV